MKAAVTPTSKKEAPKHKTPLSTSSKEVSSKVVTPKIKIKGNTSAKRPPRPRAKKPDGELSMSFITLQLHN